MMIGISNAASCRITNDDDGIYKMLPDIDRSSKDVKYITRYGEQVHHVGYKASMINMD
jgi:hypothetical protein